MVKASLNQTPIVDDELLQRGLRLSFVIKMTGLSRKDFSNKTGIPINTLRSWEQPQRNNAALKEKSTERIVHALFECGIIVTKAWLLFGLGNSPLLAESVKRKFLSVDPRFDDRYLFENLSEEDSIFQEVEFFKKLHPKGIVIIVPDNSMEPLYSAFDFVGGVYCSKDFSKFEKRNCIIQIEGEASPCVARFRYNEKTNLATVYTINMLANAEVHQWIDVQLRYVAEIVFHRKRELQSEDYL